MSNTTGTDEMWAYDDPRTDGGALVRHVAKIFGAAPVTARRRDPDAFTPHGCVRALDRWADDGGRA